MLSRVHKRHARGLLEHILRGGYEVQGISFIREDKKEDIVPFVNERLTKSSKCFVWIAPKWGLDFVAGQGFHLINSQLWKTRNPSKIFPHHLVNCRSADFTIVRSYFVQLVLFIKPSQVIERCVIVYTSILISIPEVSTFQQSLKSLLVVLLSSNDTFPIVMRLQLLHVMLHRCLDSIHRQWICHVQATWTEESR